MLFGYTDTPDGPESKSWSAPYAVLFLTAALALSLLLAWAMHRFVERPAMRRWSRSRRVQPAPASEPVTADLPVEPSPSPLAG